MNINEYYLGHNFAIYYKYDNLSTYLSPLFFKQDLCKPLTPMFSELCLHDVDYSKNYPFQQNYTCRLRLLKRALYKRQEIY